MRTEEFDVLVSNERAEFVSVQTLESNAKIGPNVTCGIVEVESFEVVFGSEIVERLVGEGNAHVDPSTGVRRFDFNGTSISDNGLFGAVGAGGIGLSGAELVPE